MVTVKREPSPASIDSANLEDIWQYDSDDFGATPPPAAPTIVTPQVPWWTPRTKPVPGPQADFEFEFQVPPPVMPTFPTVQIKRPDRTIPTTLDRYEMALKLAAEQGKTQMQVGKDVSGSTSTNPKGKHVEFSTVNAWAPPEGWRESNRAEDEHPFRFLGHISKSSLEDELDRQLKDQQNRLGLEAERQRQDAESSAHSVRTPSGNDGNQQNSMGPVSGSVWTPPPGWEESLKPQSRKALEYLRKNVTAPRTSIMEQPTPETTLADRESSVDSVWSAHFTPESTPGLPASAEMFIKHECGQMQTGLASRYVSGEKFKDSTASGQDLQDYELQLAMMRQQNQHWPMTVRTSTSHALNRAYPEYEEDPTQETPEIKTEGEVVQGVGSNTFENLEKRNVGQPADQPLIDRQKRLMLMNQEHQELMGKLPTSPQTAVQYEFGTKEYEAQVSQEPDTYAKQLQAGLEAARRDGDDIAVEYYQTNLEALERQKKAMPWLMKSRNQHQEGTPYIPFSVSPCTMWQQQKHQRSTGEMMATSETPNWSPYGYGQELMKNEAQQQQLRVNAVAVESAGDAVALQCDQSSIAVLEDQYNKSNWIPRALEERNQGPASMSPPESSHEFQDRLAQWIISEPENAKRSIVARQEQDSLRTPIPPSNGRHALQDYQMQMMLLEQQNKKRLTAARQEQNSLRTPIPPSNGQNALQDYQTQMMLLEQQNKKRLMAARQEPGFFRTPTPPSNDIQANQEYQTQLRILGQPKQRLTFARQEQDSLRTPIPPTNGIQANQEYQMQLMLLDHENKKRLPRHESKAQPVRNVKQKTEPISPAEHTEEGATLDSGPSVADRSKNKLHRKPLAFRGRPTCDD